MEINWHKDCALAGGPQTLLLKFMPPSINLLAPHIMPMRNMRDRRPVNSNRSNNRQLIVIIPAPQTLNTQNLATHDTLRIAALDKTSERRSAFKAADALRGGTYANARVGANVAAVTIPSDLDMRISKEAHYFSKLNGQPASSQSASKASRNTYNSWSKLSSPSTCWRPIVITLEYCNRLAP